MYGPTAAIRETVMPDLRERLTDLVTTAIGPSTGTATWTLDIIQGEPGPTLVERARGARLLVLGTGEHAGVRRLVTGSVSHYCLSHAHGPVVAVPARATSPVAPAASHPASTAGTGPG
jgi:nucleotide-binding universal stress UspA family protein